MNSEETVTHWIENLKEGDPHAAQRIWERYLAQLIRIARHKLGEARRRTPEEDVVARAFENFFAGVEQGRFPQLNDRQDLWRILLHITDRRATDAVRRFRFHRRHESGESALGAGKTTREPQGLARLADAEPTPEFAAEMLENLDRLLQLLGNEPLRQIAVWKMEGFTNNEIAEKLNCVERTVERKLRMIRDRFRDGQQAVDPESG